MTEAKLSKKGVHKINIKNIVPIVLVFLVALAVRAIYFTALHSIAIYPDSVEYLSSAQKIESFKIDVSRVPIYPLFIQVASQILSGFSMERATVLLQMVTSSIGVVLVFLISRNLFKSTIKAFIVSIFCAVSVCLINWDFLVLTESLSIFLVLLLLLSFMMYMRKKSVVYMIMAFVISGLMMFIRPFYIAFPIMVLMAFLLYGFLESRVRQVVVTGVLAIAVIYTCLIGYMYLNMTQNKYFGISDVSVINSLGKVLQYDMYDLGGNIKIKELIKKDIESNNGKLPYPKVFIYEHGFNTNNYSEISDFTKGIMLKHPYMYVSKTVEYMLKGISGSTVFTDYNTQNYKANWPKSLFNAVNNLPLVNNFFVIVALILFESAAIIYQAIKKRYYNWNWIFVILIIVYQFGMAIIGADGEFARLVAPTYILLFLIMFKYLYWLFDIIKDYFSKNAQKDNGFDSSYTAVL